MTRVVDSFFHKKWLIETKFKDYQDYYGIFDNIKDNRSSTLTATNNGIQHYFKTGIPNGLADNVREFCNQVLLKNNIPAQARDLVGGWALKYNPNGWQAFHNHAMPEQIITCVLYFDTNKSNDHTNGALYAYFPEPNGEGFTEVFSCVAGKLIIAEGSLYHGAYPTTTERKAIVLDFKQEKILDRGITDEL